MYGDSDFRIFSLFWANFVLNPGGKIRVSAFYHKVFVFFNDFFVE